MKVTQEIFYLINFKPLLNFKKELKNLNVLYCKNFFLFFLLLENIIKTKNTFSLIIKKKNKKSKSFLRAPNKYKKAQVKIELIRYEVKFIFNYYYDLTFIKVVNLKFLLYFIKFFFFFFLFFESTLFYLRKKKIKIKLDSYYSKIIFEL